MLEHYLVLFYSYGTHGFASFKITKLLVSLDKFWPIFIRDTAIGNGGIYLSHARMKAQSVADIKHRTSAGKTPLRDKGKNYGILTL